MLTPLRKWNCIAAVVQQRHSIDSHKLDNFFMWISWRCVCVRCRCRYHSCCCCCPIQFFCLPFFEFFSFEIELFPFFPHLRWKVAQHTYTLLHNMKQMEQSRDELFELEQHRRQCTNCIPFDKKREKVGKKTTAIADTRCGIFSVRERESMINLFIYPLLPSSRSVIASKQTIRNWNSSCNYSVSRAQTRTQTHGQIDQTIINASNGCIAAYKQQK